MEPRDNVGELIWRACALRPGEIALETPSDERLTYAQLEDRAQRVARMLDVAPGDRVLLFFPNDARFVECLLGTLRAGAVAVLANVRLGADALAYIADHCEAEVLIAHADLADKVEAVRRAAPRLRRILAVGGEIATADPYDAAVASTPPGFQTHAVDPGDPALLMYTSGSSGRPKGCLLSHATTWWQARSSARIFHLDERDKALIMGPLYHANALWAGLLPMLYAAGAATILPGFTPSAVLAAIDRFRPTYTSGTPSMFSLLLAAHEADGGADLSSLQLLVCGSAPVPEELMARLIERTGADVVESYGLTEGGANVITPRWGIKKLGSTGLPVPDVEIRVVDIEDPERDCAPGEVGELWSRSPANLIGYLKDPELTAERVTPDGWLKTGDLVRRDDQGYVYITGRRDDMINCGGENVYPKEVETILAAHPDVAEVCVVAAKHAVKGEAPVAWVVPRAGRKPAEDELRAWFLERGPAYAHPRRVLFLDALPMSGTNKVDRAALTEDAARRFPEGVQS